MSVTAIVVNFNTGQALLDCVQALLEGTVQPRVMVIDNASSDRSAELLRNLYGNRLGVEILANPDNLGYARAVNTAARSQESDFLLVINPDCTIGRSALEKLLTALGEDDSAGLAAPCVVDSAGRIEKATLRRFPDPWKSLMTVSGLWRFGRWIPAFRGVPVSMKSTDKAVIEAEAVSGACMLIRRRAFMQVGLMDEAYGLHCEDLDLMYRLSEAGWHCLYVPGARARHEQGISSRSRPLWVHREKHRGMCRFFRKFQAAKYRLPVRWLVYTGIWLRYVLLWPWVLLRR